jgi:hypothetical protein
MMNLPFIAVCVAGMISMICYSLFVFEDIRGRLKRHRWKDLTTYHKVLFFGMMQFPILLFGMLISIPLIKAVE